MNDEERGPSSAELDREVTDSKGRRNTVRELRGRVTLIEPRVLLLLEVNAGSPATLAVMGEAIEALTQGLDAYSVVADLSEVGGAITAEYRSYIPQFFKNLYVNSHLKHVAVAFYGNPVTRIVTKFLVARMMDVPFSIHSGRPPAVQAARTALL